MTKKHKILLVGGIVLLVQIFTLREYLSPFQNEQIKVKGLACTCPDETVLEGQEYLKAMTPDSLKTFELNYSEIYVNEQPRTIADPMGVDIYLIKGHVIGKDRVSKDDPWNPLVKIDSWRRFNPLIDWSIRFLIILQLLVFGVILKKTDNK